MLDPATNMCRGHERYCTSCGNKRFVLEPSTQACNLAPSGNHSYCQARTAVKYAEAADGCTHGPGNCNNSCLASPDFISRLAHPNQRYDISRLNLSRAIGRRVFTADDDKLMHLLDKEYKWSYRLMQKEYWPDRSENAIADCLQKVRDMPSVGTVPLLPARQPSVARGGGMGPG